MITLKLITLADTLLTNEIPIPIFKPTAYFILSFFLSNRQNVDIIKEIFFSPAI